MGYLINKYWYSEEILILHWEYMEESSNKWQNIILRQTVKSPYIVRWYESTCTHFVTSATWLNPVQALIPICGWLMVIPWCVTLSGCRGWLLRYSNQFLYGDIGLFCKNVLLSKHLWQQPNIHVEHASWKYQKLLIYKKIYIKKYLKIWKGSKC